jgi:hypothetical protein
MADLRETLSQFKGSNPGMDAVLINLTTLTSRMMAWMEAHTNTIPETPDDNNSNEDPDSFFE